MKGICVSKLSETSDYRLEFSRMREHGVTHIRLMIKSLIVDEVNLGCLSEIYTEAFKAGIGLIVCMPNNKRWPDTQIKYTADQIRSFWVQVLSVGNHAAVCGYELCNEPKVSDWDTLQKELISLVRAHTDKPIVVSCTGLYFQFEKPLEGTNLWYSHHDYYPFPFTHQGIGDHPITDAVYPGLSGWSALLQERTIWNQEGKRAHFNVIKAFQDKYHVPIYIGEFSSVNGSIGGDKWCADSIELFNEFGWSWFYLEWFVEGSTFDGWKPNKARLDALKHGWSL